MRFSLVNLQLFSKLSASPDTAMKLPLPKGKLTIRYIKNRCVDQIYVAGKYLDGANGESWSDEAIENLCNQYDVPSGTQIERIGGKDKAIYTIP